MGRNQPAQEPNLLPVQIAQDQVSQIGKLINDELSKLVLNDENSTFDYVKNIIQLHDHLITQLPNIDLWVKNINKNIKIYFTEMKEGIKAADKLFNLDPTESNIVINQLKHFINNLKDKRAILEKEITHNQESLAKAMLKKYNPEIYDGLMNKEGVIDLDETDGYIPLMENKNLSLSDQFIVKNVNNGARRIKIYQTIANALITRLNQVNPIDRSFEEEIETIYEKYLNINTVLENNSLENKFPLEDKIFFERQWLEHDSIIDKAGEKLYLGKLKKHWMNHLNERKDLVRKQELMDIPQDKKIVAKEHLFAMNYDEYDLTLAEYAENIKKNITANKEYYKEETEDYVSQGHPLQYDEKGKIKALNPTTKNDIIKNYYWLRAAEFFLNNH